MIKLETVKRSMVAREEVDIGGTQDFQTILHNTVMVRTCQNPYNVQRVM
jgi:hypothetical protein